jgi:hypothetical protein
VSRKRRRPTGETIGGILVGFDQQVFRNLPPPHELVQKSKPVRGLSGQDDGLEVVFPEDAPADADRAIAEVADADADGLPGE